MWVYHPTQERLILHPTFVMKKFQNRIKNLQRWVLSKLFRISWIWVSSNHSGSHASFWSYLDLYSTRKPQNSRFQQSSKWIINNQASMCELTSLDFLSSYLVHIGSWISIFRQFQANSFKNWVWYIIIQWKKIFSSLLYLTSSVSQFFLSESKKFSDSDCFGHPNRDTGVQNVPKCLNIFFHGILVMSTWDFHRFG